MAAHPPWRPGRASTLSFHATTLYPSTLIPPAPSLASLTSLDSQGGDVGIMNEAKLWVATYVRMPDDDS